MTKNIPNLEEWRNLYDTITQVKAIAPWEWMEEGDLFGVQNPETEALGFVSIMGMLGEHYAVALYLGAEGLEGFWQLQKAGPFASPEMLLEIPLLQASFEDRDELYQQDQDLIKQLQIKFRGKKAWPLFRSHRPGFLPWFLEADEVHFLQYALEQTLDVALRFKNNPTLLEPPDEESYLIRVPHHEGNTLKWEDRMMRVPPPEPRTIPIPMDAQMLEMLKQVPRSNHNIEIDFFMFPTPIHEKGVRPFFPYMLLITSTQNGMILGQEVFCPEPSLETMWSKVPLNVVTQLVRLGLLPKAIRVRSDLLLQLFRPVAEEIGVNLGQSQQLRSLDVVKEALFQHFINW